MNNTHDEIKKLLKASRTMLSNKLTEQSIFEIKKSHGLITEQESPLGVGNEVTKRDKVSDTIEKNIEFTVSPEDEKKQSYRVSGGVITLYGKEKQDLELTTDEKAAFQQTHP